MLSEPWVLARAPDLDSSGPHEGVLRAGQGAMLSSWPPRVPELGVEQPGLWIKGRPLT